MNGCNHEWRRVHEQSIIGGSFPIGWKCRKCGEYMDASALTPAGLPGTVVNEHELVGINGARVRNGSGGTCSRQIVHENGELEYIP